MFELGPSWDCVLTFSSFVICEPPRHKTIQYKPLDMTTLGPGHFGHSNRNSYCQSYIDSQSYRGQ